MNKEEEIEKIESAKELTKKILFLKSNPFAPNRVIFQGTLFAIRSQDGHLVEFGKKKLIEDYFHKDHYIEAGHYGQIYELVRVYNDTEVFNAKDENTWIRVETRKITKEGFYAETSDFEFLHSNSRKIITKYEGELKSLYNTDESMEILGFKRGKTNEDYWFHKSEIKELDTMLPYKKFDNIVYKTDTKQFQKDLISSGAYTQEYVNTEVSKAIKNNIKYGVDSLTFSAFEGLRYSFGVEIETCIGRLSVGDYQDLNVKAVHDGSLRDAAGNTPGGEYVTGILVGDAGLVQLDNICRVLATKCKVNNQCGVHVHCGGMDWNKEDICYAYILAEQLENELFNVLPKSRRNNSYCRRLTQLTLNFLPDLKNEKGSSYDIVIDKIYDLIFREVTYIKGKNDGLGYLEEGFEANFTSTAYQNRNVNHPNGSKCGYDKNAQRYCWLNFVTLLYNTKGITGSRTLEIRNHSATMNFNKIKNWIKIFFAMIRFVEMNKSKIRRGKVTLEEVIRAAYPKTGDKLIQYVEERKELFKIQGESVDYEEPLESKTKKTIKEVVTI